MRNTAPIGLGILAVAALFGAVAWGVSAVVFDFETVAAFVIGVGVAIVTAIVLWLGWRDPAPGPQGLQDLTPDSAARTKAQGGDATATTSATADSDGSAPMQATPQPAPFASTPPAGDASTPPVKAGAGKARDADTKTTSATTDSDPSEGDATQEPGSTLDQAPAPGAIGGGASAASSVEAKPDAAATKSTPASKGAASPKATPAPEAASAPEPATEPNHSMPPAAESEPETLSGPREGGADDLKLLKGVGPQLERTLNELGFYHFDQVANWGPGEVAWVDSRLRFKGRIQRDDWISQAKILADGGETEFSTRKKK